MPISKIFRISLAFMTHIGTGFHSFLQRSGENLASRCVIPLNAIYLSKVPVMLSFHPPAFMGLSQFV